MKVDFYKLDFNERPILVLKNLDETPIQTLGYAFNIEFDPAYNEVSEITFDVPYKVDGVLTPHYDEIVGMRIVDLVGCGQFILVDPEESSDGVKTIKTCKGYSLEYEFAKKDIYLEAGTYNFFSGLNTSDENTIIGRIQERLPDWKFDVDESLIGKYRTFEDLNKKVYDFIKSDVQEKYGCIFDFDTYGRVVHVVDVDSDVITKQVYLSKDNLIKEIDINEDSDSVVTCLDVYGADDVTIRSVNPTGLNKIYNLDYFMNETNFSSDFISRWRKWESDCESQQSIYYDYTVAYNMKLLQILTAESEINNLKADIVAQENVRAVIIQGMAQGIKEQSDLDTVNKEIKNINSQISKKESSVTDLKTQATALHEKRIEINKSLLWTNEDGTKNYFTAEESSILNRYLIEDTLQDESFVAETAATYIEEDYATAVDGSIIAISKASSIIESVDALGNRVYSIVGGKLSVGSLSGNIIKATLYCNSDGTAVFSAYSDGGVVGEAAFSDGNVTLCGECNGVSSATTSLSFKIVNGHLYFTENCTEYKRLQIEWDLYNYAKQLLKEKSTPTYNFSVDSSNFLSIDDFALFKDQLTLGNRIYLDLDAEVVEPYVVSIHCNFEDHTDFSIEFSSSYNSFDKSFALAKLLEQSVSMGKTLNYKSGAFSAFVNSGASTAVKEFMDSALDISKNAVMSSKNQAISFDDTGIRVRKWKEGKKEYEPEEIWIVDNVIAFTEDNWQTAKMAIGKIFDPNLVSYVPATNVYDPKSTYYTRSGTAEPYTYHQYTYNAATWADDYSNLYVMDNNGIAYGIAAPYVVGTLIAGQNLVIDTENGSFKVDNSGVYIDSLKFYITHKDKTTNTIANELELLNQQDSNIADKLSNVINADGSLKADAMSGIIDSSVAQMQSAKGNVLFDSDGIWLMNASAKELATQAVWMNENGIVFGTGKQTSNPGAVDSGWNWTTAISHTGIAANAISAGKLSGMEIVGGELKIGEQYSSSGALTGYNFVVDSDGNVTAQSGTFTGEIQARDIMFEDQDGKFVSILNSNGLIGNEWLESLSVESLTTGEEDSYNIGISGRKIKFYNESGSLVGLLTSQTYNRKNGNINLLGRQVHIGATLIENDVDSPYITLYGDQIEMWANGDTGIRINDLGDSDKKGKVEIFGNLYINNKLFDGTTIAVFG